MLKRVSIFILSAVLLMTIGNCFSGCEVLKGKREVRTDSTSVVKKDSGQVLINSNNKTDSLAYWREIWTLARDTNVTVNNIYPTSYTKEYGVREIKETQVIYDSSWKSAYDSLNKKVDTVEKSKQTKVATNPILWVIGGLVLLIAMKILLPFKITRI